MATNPKPSMQPNPSFSIGSSFAIVPAGCIFCDCFLLSKNSLPCSYQPIVSIISNDIVHHQPIDTGFVPDLSIYCCPLQTPLTAFTMYYCSSCCSKLHYATTTLIPQLLQQNTTAYTHIASTSCGRGYSNTCSYLNSSDQHNMIAFNCKSKLSQSSFRFVPLSDVNTNNKKKTSEKGGVCDWYIYPIYHLNKELHVHVIQLKT